MNHAFRTRIGGSVYKYVDLYEFIDGGGKTLRWRASMPKGYGSCTAYFDTEREAAIFVDKKFISIGREPVNILVRK